MHWLSLNLFTYRGPGNLDLASTCPLVMILLHTCMARCITKVALRGVMTLSTPVARFCTLVLSGSHWWLGQLWTSARCVHRLAGGPWHLILPAPWLGQCQCLSKVRPGGTAEPIVHWSNQLTHITRKMSQFVNLLRRLSWFLPSSLLVLYLKSYILPCVDYCDVV